jgi:hypothetical protein
MSWLLCGVFVFYERSTLSNSFLRADELGRDIYAVADFHQGDVSWIDVRHGSGIGDVQCYKQGGNEIGYRCRTAIRRRAGGNDLRFALLAHQREVCHLAWRRQRGRCLGFLVDLDLRQLAPR